MSQRIYYSEEAKKRARMQMTAVASICLALGAAIGSVIAILFAPQGGEQIREELGHIGDNVQDRLQHQIDDLRERFDRAAS